MSTYVGPSSPRLRLPVELPLPFHLPNRMVHPKVSPLINGVQIAAG